MTLSDRSRVNALNSVIRRWNIEKISYAVLNGFDGNRAGRDLDVMINPECEVLGLAMAAEELVGLGYEVGWPPALFGRRLCAFKHDNWSTGIEVHSVPGVRWRNVVFAMKPSTIQVTNEVKIDVWASFAKRVLTPLLAEGGAVSARLASEPSLDDTGKELIFVMLAQFVGAHLAGHLLANWRTTDEMALDQLAGQLRKAASSRAWKRRPLQSVGSLALQLSRRLVSRFCPCGPLVALVGPDGAGKSTVLEALRSGPPSIFTRVVIRHWRPGLLPSITELLGRGKSKSTGAPTSLPRRIPGRLQWLRALYYYVDYVVGWWVLDRYDLALQRAVIYDRCVLDMVVEPMRFGLSTPSPGRWIWRFIARPDAVVLLCGEPKLILSRKAEITETDILDQYYRWSNLSVEGLRLVKVDAAGSVEDIVERIRQVLIRAFLDKNQQAIPVAKIG